MAQFNSANGAFQQHAKTLFESNMLASPDGAVVSNTNPLPVIGTTTNHNGKLVLTVDDDTVQHTSLNRRKVSTFELVDYATFTTSKDTDIFDEISSGTANSTHAPYFGMVKFEVGSAAGDQIIRQSKRVQRYLPGRQNEFGTTVILGAPTTGIRRRIGMFDESDGFYFEDSGDGTYRCVLRRNTAGGIVTESYARADWNVDKLDGTGRSGLTLDLSLIQHLSIEYEWYGAGQIEWNFVIDNNKHPIHRILHANREDHTWSSRASLPIRYELTNVTGATGTHTSYQGAHSLSAEGTSTLVGRQDSISNSITGRTLTLANVFYPVVAIRLASDKLNSVIIPDEYSGATLDNTSIFVRILEGVTITGGTWVAVGGDSPIEYNITATSFTGGTTLSTKYISSGNMGAVSTFPERSITQLQRSTTTTLGDTSSIFLIAIAATGAQKSAWASLGWIEVR